MNTGRIWLLLLVLMGFALSSAGLQFSGSSTERQTLTGTLVDITCATNPTRDLTKLRWEHTRRCLLMPICAESGYALLTDQEQILRFNAKGDELARRLIEKHLHTQKWRVSIEGNVRGDQLDVERIRLL
jgi:hypothetical protein